MKRRRNPWPETYGDMWAAQKHKETLKVAQLVKGTLIGPSDWMVISGIQAGRLTRDLGGLPRIGREKRVRIDGYEAWLQRRLHNGKMRWMLYGIDRVGSNPRRYRRNVRHGHHRHHSALSKRGLMTKRERRRFTKRMKRHHRALRLKYREKWGSGAGH